MAERIIAFAVVCERHARSCADTPQTVTANTSALQLQADPLGIDVDDATEMLTNVARPNAALS